jgi:hypothetical protein
MENPRKFYLNQRKRQQRVKFYDTDTIEQSLSGIAGTG